YFQAEDGIRDRTVTGVQTCALPIFMPGVEWVVGNSHKTEIADLLAGAPYHGNILVGDIFARQDFLTAPVMDAAGERTRPNLKIRSEERRVGKEGRTSRRAENQHKRI